MRVVVFAARHGKNPSPQPSPKEIVQLLKCWFASSCKTWHLYRVAGEVAVSAVGGGLLAHGRGLACKTHYLLPDLRARPLPEGEAKHP